MSCKLLIASLFAASALADTITTTEHLSINGYITQISSGVIELSVQARAIDKKETRWIPLNKVETIEFNSMTFNPGGPPLLFGIKPAAPAQPKAQAPPVPAGTIVIRGGSRQPCKLVNVDGAKVVCQEKPYTRQTVVRIVVGGQ
jgi:hypothetical protein